VWKYISESKLTIRYCAMRLRLCRELSWDVTVCRFGRGNKCFGRVCCLGLLGRSLKADQMHIKQNKFLYDVICERS